ncbi:MAG: T9SS type A sorting domain-containing protein [Candidatus Marinimicrobia bacterium]|nr:T9SS type A sorting domain-containing protein [Candidatus Neomarinimicrobiota bacterium]MBT3576483.1 T9SS type A sorting domain-containing protein [Candidatus Neomarinimicrobiota bacterium]MBT3681269.1 T9SS type A sorting domain-containing protein [Candidatus Neomarinimicrobiota bacterium]MBT4130093.1 T9SS type A sorting domain-containing protein [Candidatus Neomarinimicrobiota bacterium]MBT4295182.1 T9SS type A sorting domain-containing protein [Candidatus Neomarinimicrobiota bacterium]
MKKLKQIKLPQGLMIPLFLCTFATATLQAQNYGFMYIANGTLLSSTITADTWYTIGSETATTDDFVAGPLLGWNNTTKNRLTETAGESKKYLIEYSISFSGSQADWSLAIAVNGTVQTDLVKLRSINNANKDKGNVTGSGHVSITSGQYIELVASPSADGTLTAIDAQVTLVELTQNSSSDYGGMVITGNSTPQDFSAADTYIQLTGFSAISNLEGWTMGTNDLATSDASSAGKYLVTYSISFIGSGKSDNAPAGYSFGVSNGDVTPDKIITYRTTADADIGNVGGVGILTIADGDDLSLYASCTKQVDITIQYANLSFYKISGTTTASYGGMYRSTEQSVPLTQNTWTEVPNLSSKTLNNWTFESNGLHATTGTLSAGMYYLKYSASVDASNASDIPREFSVGIFVGGSLHTPSRVNRKLSSNSDVGALGGVSLINIDSDTDIVKFMIMNSTDGGTLDVKKASIILHLIEEGPTIDGSLPVELSRWIGTSDRGNVRLAWSTESEIENQGFAIERKLVEEHEFRQIASYMSDEQLIGQGSTTKLTNYEFVDEDVIVGQRYEYRLCDVDYKGKLTKHAVIDVLVTKDENTQHPATAQLIHAYPNPFNPATTIEYAILQASQVNLTIYDLGGNRIAQLVQGPQEAGWHSVVWNGLNDVGQAIPTGVYLANVQDQTHSRVIKISYLK